MRAHIGQYAKFLDTLHSSNAESLLAVVQFKKTPDQQIEGFRFLWGDLQLIPQKFNCPYAHTTIHTLGYHFQSEVQFGCPWT